MFYCKYILIKGVGLLRKPIEVSWVGNLFYLFRVMFIASSLNIQNINICLVTPVTNVSYLVMSIKLTKLMFCILNVHVHTKQIFERIAAVTWLEYCRYRLNPKTINQSRECHRCGRAVSSSVCLARERSHHHVQGVTRGSC